VGKAARARFLGAQVLFGVANGFIPCGLVYAALALPTASASPVDGAVVMAAFGLGTFPAMFAVGWLSGRLRGLGLGWRRAMAVVVLVAGAWALTMRAPRGHGGDRRAAALPSPQRNGSSPLFDLDMD
jgi:uncharacterized protein